MTWPLSDEAALRVAAEVAKGCPGLLTGGLVEVRALAGLAKNL